MASLYFRLPVQYLQIQCLQHYKIANPLQTYTATINNRKGFGKQHTFQRRLKIQTDNFLGILLT